MEPYIQPVIQGASSNIILHCGTNDLKTSSDIEQIPENIINLEKYVKADENNAIIFGLTPRNDQLNKKKKSE